MPIWIANLLAPPVFANDEEKTRLARLLNVILITIIILVLVFSIPAWFMTPHLGRLAVELSLAFLAFLLLVFLRRGHVQLSGLLLSLALWTIVSYGTYQEGGFNASIMASYFGIIVIAELLLGIRAGALIGFLSIAFTGWMVYADSQGIMPPAPAYATQTTLWGEFSVVVLGIVVLISLVMRSLKDALNQARQNEKELAAKVEEVQLLAKQAVEASEFKSRLIARISHELRTPLGAMMGMTEMLQHQVYGPLNQEQQNIALRIIKNGHTLEQVFAELLDQSQIESGQLSIKKEPFSATALIQSVYSDSLPLAEGKELALRVDIASAFPDQIIGDELRTRQILSNLVINAIKFTNNGIVEIRAWTEEAAFWKLQVSDTGIGISPEKQKFVFEPFRQVDETMGRNIGGVGLGLAIVQQLIKSMDGSIVLESELGRGSTFTVTLPLTIVESKEAYHQNLEAQL